LEGDVDLKAKSDLYAMIGVVGEVYPLKKETFERTYDVSPEPYTLSAEYAPEVIDRIACALGIEPATLFSCPVDPEDTVRKFKEAALTESAEMVSRYFAEKLGELKAEG
jgi:hypothetical protein